MTTKFGVLSNCACYLSGERRRQGINERRHGTPDAHPPTTHIYNTSLGPGQPEAGEVHAPQLRAGEPGRLQPSGAAQPRPRQVRPREVRLRHCRLRAVWVGARI